MISEQHMKWLATFLSKGQYDIRQYVSDEGEVSGDPNHGKAIFQNVCAACHGYNGTAINWGDDDEPAYVGTAIRTRPTFWPTARPCRRSDLDRPAVAALTAN
jgi:thiosulfate dehydrogenase